MCIITVDTYSKEPGVILETERLALRQFGPDDALFIIDLLNDPDWLTNIGDRDVHSVEQAVAYLETGPMTMYATYGFGPYVVQRKTNHVPIGMCGLFKREFLEDVDIGYALLPAYRGAGYALEAAQGVMCYASSVLGIKRLLAITAKENERSARLLEKLGLHFERMIPYGGAKEDVRLFSGTLVHTRDPTK